MEENHSRPTAGHQGIAKTIARIARRYYWPGMFRDTARFVRSCSVCRRFKGEPRKLPGKMQPSRNCIPWETVSTDLVGPLPRSSKGNCYIVVFQDRFTKWVHCRAIRKATAKAVSQALYEDILMRFGCPRVVISDNGTQYTGKMFRGLLKDLGIQHRLTPPYTPQANPVERTNKTLKTMVASFCEGNHRKWDIFLPDFEFALNTSRHDSTGFSPAFLNFGRELEAPSTLCQAQDKCTDDLPEEDSTVDYRGYTEHLRKLAEVYELARINLGRAFSAQSRNYNLRRREWICQIGDRVMKRENPLSSADKGFAAKLAPRFSGPYEVRKIVSPVVYDLRDSKGKWLRHIHVKDLKPLNADDIPG